MDWHKLQQTLYNIEPTDISSDYAKLKSLAGGDVPTQEPSTDYLNESASVPDGSLQLDRDYSVSDFAKLAGVNIPDKQQLSEKTMGQKIGDMGVVKAFNRGRENYNRINLDFDTGSGKKKPSKPTVTKKPDQTIPKQLQKDHRVVKKNEIVRSPQEIPAGTKMYDEQENLYRWEGNMWTMYNPTTRNWQTGKIRNNVAFKMYMDAAKENPIKRLLIPRRPSGDITQPNVRENDTMDNEKDTTQNKSNNAKINPVRLAKYFGGEDTMMLARAIAKMQQGRELARTEMMAVAGAFQALLDMDRERLRYLMSILTQASKQPTAEAKKPKAPKERNPHSQDLEALRKSGAGGAHRDKKRDLPRKAKHKGAKGDVSMESLKSDLERLLRDK